MSSLSVSRGTSPIAIALAAGIREIAGDRARRRATMTVIDGGGPAVDWIRQRAAGTEGRRAGDLRPAEWHIEGDRLRGMLITSCGLNLGTDETALERHDGTLLGGRCPACQGAALRGHAL